MRSASWRDLFLALALLAIAFATLRPVAGQPSMVWTTCLVCGDHGTADMILNVLLFVPLGVALALQGNRIGRATVIGACLSAAIEIAQLYIPGRDSSFSDIVTNTLGTAVGAGLSGIAPRLFAGTLPRPHLSEVASVIATAICFATGLLLTPAFPRSRYYGQWTPNLAHLEWYRGRVQSALLDTQPLPSGPLEDSEQARAVLSADSGFVLHVRGTAGPSPSHLAPFFSIYDDHRREVLLVGPDRDDLVFRIRTKAASVRLDRPDIRLVHVLRGLHAGDPLDVVIRARAGDYRFVLNGVAHRPTGFTVGLGWALLLYPEDLPTWFSESLSALWLSALFFPTGFWLLTRHEALVAAVAVVGSLLGAPALTALVSTPPTQWAGAILGLLAGFGMQVALARRQVGANPGL